MINSMVAIFFMPQTVILHSCGFQNTLMLFLEVLGDTDNTGIGQEEMAF